MRIDVLLSVAGLLAACQSPTRVERDSTSAVVLDHALRVRVDNDSIGFGDSTDRGYTNGLEFEWTPPMTDPDGSVARFVRRLPFFVEAADSPHVAFYFGQSMFSPEDIARVALIPDDRPYAGWLYGGVAARNIQLDSSDKREDRFDEWRLDLGIVGPSSLADTTQIEWHEIIASPRPEGWRNQLRDEPAVLLAFRHIERSHHRQFSDSFGADTTFELEGKLGNVRTAAGLGASVRLGFNLPRDFGTAARVVRRTFADGTLRVERPKVPWSVYAIGGMRGSLVLYDIFLDGNTYRDSHDVERNPFVADLYGGIEVRLSEHARVSYTHVLRTAEFESGATRGDMQDFASIQVMLDF